MTNTSDAVDAAPGDGGCASGSDACTLRAAVQEANALAGPDRIELGPSAYRLSLSGRDEDAAATGDLDVTDDLEIAGAGGRATVVSAQPNAGASLGGSGIDRVFDVWSGKLTLSRLTVSDGNPGADGGDILSTGELNLTDVTVKSASAAGDGGGIASGGPASLNRVTVTKNRASASGGGVASAGALSALNSTIFENTAAGDGGGLAVLDGSATLTHVTLGVNAASASGRQIWNGASAEVTNSILESCCGPTGPGCGGAPIGSGGHNVDGDGSCALAGTGDVSGVPIATYGVLQNAGGETDVDPFYPSWGGNSLAAIDLAGASPACPPVDQRGLSRPRGAGCDAGAFEQGYTDIAVSIFGLPARAHPGDVLSYTAVVRNQGPLPAAAHLHYDAHGTKATSNPSAGTCGRQGSWWGDCSLGRLDVGANVIVKGTLTVSGPGGVDFALSAGPDVPPVTDPWEANPANNSADAKVDTGPLPPPAKPGSCRWYVFGTDRNDVLRGSIHDDVLLGYLGDDKLIGRAGKDCLYGGPGNDRLDGGRGSDRLVGGPGKDGLIGGPGRDVLRGSSGNDTLGAADGTRDLVDCGKGRDSATVDRRDRIRGCERVRRRG